MVVFDLAHRKVEILLILLSRLLALLALLSHPLLALLAWPELRRLTILLLLALYTTTGQHLAKS